MKPSVFSLLTWSIYCLAPSAQAAVDLSGTTWSSSGSAGLIASDYSASPDDMIVSLDVV